MNFRTTSTIEEQMSHVKKYAPLLLLNIPRKYQYLLYSIPFIAIFADLIFNLLNHIYFLCIFDFFLFIVTIHTIISLRKASWFKRRLYWIQQSGIRKWIRCTDKSKRFDQQI